MSHIVTIQVQVTDLEAIRSAARRLNLKEPVHGRAEVFNTAVDGVLVELGNDWIYPICANLQTGELLYDNFGGQWGDKKYLDKFVQTYCIEKATLEARHKGYSVMEQPLADGSIKLTIGGAA